MNEEIDLSLSKLQIAVSLWPELTYIGYFRMLVVVIKGLVHR